MGKACNWRFRLPFKWFNWVGFTAASPIFCIKGFHISSVIVCSRIKQEIARLIKLVFRTVQDHVILNTLYWFWQYMWIKVVNTDTASIKQSFRKGAGVIVVPSKWTSATELQYSEIKLFGCTKWSSHHRALDYCIDRLVILIQKENGTIGENSKNYVSGEKVSRFSRSKKGMEGSIALLYAKWTDCGKFVLIHRGIGDAVVSYGIDFYSWSARSN